MRTYLFVQTDVSGSGAVPHTPFFSESWGSMNITQLCPCFGSSRLQLFVTDWYTSQIEIYQMRVLRGSDYDSDNGAVSGGAANDGRVAIYRAD